MPYTVKELSDIVQMNLGGLGGVSVELTEDHYKRAISAALNLLCRYRPMHGYQVVACGEGGNKYRLQARNVSGVMDVFFFNNGYRLEFAPYYSRWVDRDIERVEMKEAQRAFDDKPEWHAQRELNPENNQMEWWVYTTITKSSFVDVFARLPNFMAVTFNWYIEPTDDPQVGVEAIPYDMRQWVEEYATAFARKILGDIRGKYGGVPGAADGSTLRNDGATQVERGEQACRDLEADLRSRRRQLPILFM